MRVGIVGAEAAKFTQFGELRARDLIQSLIAIGDVVVSGGCHLGGVDIWAAEAGRQLSLEVVEYLPENRRWKPRGYEQRNLLIAEDSDIVHCIAVDVLPSGFKGMRFSSCYHHDGEIGVPPHVKSGGCWTMRQARKIGRLWQLHVISNYNEEPYDENAGMETR